MIRSLESVTNDSELPEAYDESESNDEPESDDEPDTLTKSCMRSMSARKIANLDFSAL